MAKHIIKTVGADELANESGYKIVKTALFYAAASLAIAAFLTPLGTAGLQKVAVAIGGDADRASASGVDRTITGSVKDDGSRLLRIRRSVLQADPDKPCFVLANGQTKGDC